MPLFLLAFLDEEKIKELAGEPNDDEKYLMLNKGKDGEQGTSDFWMFCLIVAFSVGQAFTANDMAGTLTLRNYNESYSMIQLQHVCTAVAATLTGFILLYCR